MHVRPVCRVIASSHQNFHCIEVLRTMTLSADKKETFMHFRLKDNFRISSFHPEVYP
jgi:hypothetical protein